VSTHTHTRQTILIDIQGTLYELDIQVIWRSLLLTHVTPPPHRRHTNTISHLIHVTPHNTSTSYMSHQQLIQVTPTPYVTAKRDVTARRYVRMPTTCAYAHRRPASHVTHRHQTPKMRETCDVKHDTCHMTFYTRHVHLRCCRTHLVAALLQHVAAPRKKRGRARCLASRSLVPHTLHTHTRTLTVRGGAERASERGLRERTRERAERVGASRESSKHTHRQYLVCTLTQCWLFIKREWR